METHYGAESERSWIEVTCSARLPAHHESIRDMAPFRHGITPILRRMHVWRGLPIPVHGRSTTCTLPNASQPEDAVRTDEEERWPVQDAAAKIFGQTRQVKKRKVALVHCDAPRPAR